MVLFKTVVASTLGAAGGEVGEAVAAGAVSTAAGWGGVGTGVVGASAAASLMGSAGCACFRNQTPPTTSPAIRTTTIRRRTFMKRGGCLLGQARG